MKFGMKREDFRENENIMRFIWIAYAGATADVVTAYAVFASSK